VGKSCDISQFFEFVHKAMLNVSRETALHLAVSHGPENIVEELVDIITKRDQSHEALKVEK
jgi:hypothetical protein